jgi:hypothetical protein
MQYGSQAEGDGKILPANERYFSPTFKKEAKT